MGAPERSIADGPGDCAGRCFYRITWDDNIRRQQVLSDVVAASGRVVSYLSKRIAGGPLSCDVLADGRVMDYTENFGMMPISSVALAEAVRPLVGQQVGFHEVKVRDERAERVMWFIRPRLACADRSLSSWEGVAGRRGVVTYDRLVLDASRIPSETEIFRLADDPRCIVVSQVVKDTMVRSGCLGALFLKIAVA